MAEKKKMSVAEILAAARKGNAGGSAPPASAEPEPSAPPAADAEAAPPAAPAPAAQPKPAAGGAKPSVAEILAMARAKKEAAAPADEKPAAPKPKPAAKPVAKAEKPAATDGVAAAAPRDTSSILAAARQASKPGPMSKAEAAVKLKPAAPEKAPKGATAAPPMPAKPDYAKPKAPKAESAVERRGFIVAMVGSSLALGFLSLTATFAMWTLAFARFMFPNMLMEPPSRFKVGYPSDFPAGSVEEKFKAQFGVWVVNTEYRGARQIFALKTVCTHLGCTPNWLESEQKFKCPCHGSGFYKDGINFEGPAPRPLERYAVRVADDGQLEVDKSRTFQEELDQWKDPASFVAV